MHAAAVPSTSQGSQEIRKYRRSMLASVGFKHKHIQHFNNRIQLFKSQSAATLPPVNTEEPLLNYVISYKLTLEEA